MLEEADYVKFDHLLQHRARVLYIQAQDELELPMWFKILATKYRDQVIFANITRQTLAEKKLIETLKIKSEDQSFVFWRKKTKDKTIQSDGQLQKYSGEMS